MRSEVVNRQQSLRVYRDETNLAASNSITEALKKALNQSDHLILLATPAAAQSKWVNQEVTHWIASKGATNLLIVLADGNISWSDSENDFDWLQTNALPRAIMGAFNSEPSTPA
jgi:hypothetical protein